MENTYNPFKFKNINLKTKKLNDEDNYFIQSKKNIINLLSSNNDTFQILFNFLIHIKNYLVLFYNKMFITFYLYSNYFKIFYFFIYVFIFSYCYSSNLEHTNGEITNKLLYTLYYSNMETVHIFYDSIKANKNNDENKLQENNFINKDKEIELTKINEKKKFHYYLCEIYGNKSIFMVNLKDLKNFVDNNLINENQAYILWENILKNRESKMKIKINYNNYNNIYKEIYLFNYIPIKSVILSFFCVLILYLFIWKTIASKIRFSIFFNLIGLIIIFLLMFLFYLNSYYFPSSILFIQLIYFFKCLFDSLLINFGLEREDFEIISLNLSAKNYLQFFSKVFILFNLVFFSGYLALNIFNFFLNYIFFYVTLFYLFTFLGNCFEPLTPKIFKPLKNILIVILGIINFLISKFHNSIFRYNFNLIYYDIKIPPKNLTLNNIFPDSLNLISNLFSFFCFTYLGDILTKKTHNINLYSKKIFSYDDSLWLLCFLLILLINIIGYKKNDFISYIISYYIVRVTMERFLKIFNLKFVRTIYSLVNLIHILLNYTTSNNDKYLNNLFNWLKNANFIIKLAGYLQILYIIHIQFKMNKLNSESNNEEINGQIQQEEFGIFIEIITSNNKNFSYLNLVCILIDYFINYMIIIFVNYILIYQEKEICFYILFDLLIFSVFFLRKYYILKESVNDFEYFFNFIIETMIGFRFLNVLKKNEFSKILANFNILILIIFYHIKERKNFFVTIFIALHFFVATLIKKSEFLFSTLIFFIFLPICYKMCNNHDEEVNIILISFLLILPAMAVIGVSFIDFEKIFNVMNLINESFSKYFFGIKINSLFFLINNEENDYFEYKIFDKLFME